MRSEEELKYVCRAKFVLFFLTRAKFKSYTFLAGFRRIVYILINTRRLHVNPFPIRVHTYNQAAREIKL